MRSWNQIPDPFWGIIFVSLYINYNNFEGESPGKTAADNSRNLLGVAGFKIKSQDGRGIPGWREGGIKSSRDELRKEFPPPPTSLARWKLPSWEASFWEYSWHFGEECPKIPSNIPMGSHPVPPQGGGHFSCHPQPKEVKMALQDLSPPSDPSSLESHYNQTGFVPLQFVEIGQDLKVGRDVF